MTTTAKKMKTKPEMVGKISTLFHKWMFEKDIKSDCLVNTFMVRKWIQKLA